MNDKFSTVLNVHIHTAGSGKNKETGEHYNYVVFSPLKKDDAYKDLLHAIEDCYKGAKKQYVPKWWSDFEDRITAKSVYDIPVLVDDEKMAFADWVSRGVKDAEVKIKLNVASGIYANAIIETKQGKEYNPFEGM